MQFTGQELTKKRNFYTQTGNFGFGLACSVDNINGKYNFGFSGNQYNFEIVLQSGKILKNGLMIHDYQAFKDFNLEIEISSGNYNIKKNDVPMIFGLQKNTGYFDYFYFNRENTGLGAIFNVYITGDNYPLYIITDKGYLINSGQTGVTGYFINQSQFLINVFDSSADGLQGLEFNKLNTGISGFNTGKFVYSGDYSQFDFTQPILTTFNTNFNNATVLFYINDLRQYDKFVLLNDINDFSFNSDFILNRDLSYNNYSGGFITDTFNTNLIFIIKSISGSGSFSSTHFAINTQYTGMVYGNIFESGILTGQIAIPTGDETLTGNLIINLSQFAWATGVATGRFNGIATGYGTGLGYTGRSVGIITGLLTGFIYDGSGTLNIFQNQTGIPSNPISLDYQFFNSATGYINISGLHYNDIIYIGVDSPALIKGLQFFNETGLIYYLSGNQEHKVNGFYSGGQIYLTSNQLGINGNGTFVKIDNCDIGSALFSPFLTGGAQSGSTGLSVVYIQPFTGYFTNIITGSGNYSIFVSGNGNGTFFYNKTFTGSWDLLTGLDAASLTSLKRPGNYNSNTISGSGIFPPNSTINFQLTHNKDQFTTDALQLIISGLDVINPINQIINN